MDRKILGNTATDTDDRYRALNSGRFVDSLTNEAIVTRTNRNDHDSIETVDEPSPCLNPQPAPLTCLEATLSREDSSGFQDRASPTSVATTLPVDEAIGKPELPPALESDTKSETAASDSGKGIDETLPLNSDKADKAAASDDDEGIDDNESDAVELLEQAQAQRLKMIGNIQKKKQLLAESASKLQTLEKELAHLKHSHNQLAQENSSLHTGLAQATMARDEVKNKLRIKQDVLRETRLEKEDMEKRLKRSEQHRLLEQELLQNYRKLAVHTGFYKWGKEIRMLEQALEKASAEQHD
jgi:hypothetical protein